MEEISEIGPSDWQSEMSDLSLSHFDSFQTAKRSQASSLSSSHNETPLSSRHDESDADLEALNEHMLTMNNVNLTESVPENHLRERVSIGDFPPSQEPY